MSNHRSIRKDYRNLIASAFILITASSLINNGYLGTNKLVYGQSDLDQVDSNTTDTLNIRNIPSEKVSVGDIDIAYKAFGNGDPILLISGSGNVMDVWPSYMLQDFSSNHTVIIFDHRGVGNTTLGSKPITIQQLADDTARFLDATEIQSADVLAFSMGSFVAQQLALMHPEKINRLILYGASCGGEEGIPQSPIVAKLLSDFVNNRTQDIRRFLSVTFPPEWVKSHPDYLETIPRSTELIPSSTLVQQFDAVENWLATNWNGVCDELAKISNPVLIITGTEDTAVPSANSLILAKKIPGAWLVQIKGAGHGLMYQYPEQFTGVLDMFLENTERVRVSSQS
ncbi:MAG: alpha/beta hydrolase [Nitrososphaeraceae archaeon]